MPGVFINYRREDSATSAGRLYDWLVDKFGKARVFIDVGAIDPGQDFLEEVKTRIGTCDVQLVLIGPRWLECRDEHGNRRLDNDGDLVVLEIVTALDAGLRVIPILLDGAQQPRAAHLPERLSRLAFRNAMELAYTRWEQDVAHIIDVLDGILRRAEEKRREASTPPPVEVPEPAPPPVVVIPPAPRPKRRWKWLVIGAVAALLAFVAGALWYQSRPITQQVVRETIDILPDDTKEEIAAREYALDEAQIMGLYVARFPALLPWIQKFGIAFQPSEAYIGIFRDAGVGQPLLAAITSASFHGPSSSRIESPQYAKSFTVFQHLARGAGLEKAGRVYEAASAFHDAASANSQNPAAVLADGHFLKLPQANPEERFVILTMVDGSTVTLNQEPNAIERVQARLTDIFKTRAEKVLYIVLDRSPDFPTIARVVKIIVDAGIDRLIPVTQEAAEKSGYVPRLKK